MELATPISNLFNKKETAEKLISASDCLECRDESHYATYPKQYLFHFDLDIIHGWNQKQKRYLSSAIGSKPDLKIVTFHMGSSCRDRVVEDGVYQPAGKVYPQEELFLNAKNNIAWLRDLNKKDIVIGVENNNYYPTPAYQHVTEGDFITHIVRDNGVSFAFDLAHAKITAHNKKIEYSRYLSTLPMGEIIQIHISNYKVNEKNIAYDAHELPDESILREAERLAKAYLPKYLTVEYYQNADCLLRILGACKGWRCNFKYA